jgi:hypothetical protein
MLCQEKFDIFQGHVDRDPIWVEVVDRLGCAFERIKELAAEKPAHYFVKSLNTHKLLASVDSEGSPVWCTRPGAVRGEEMSNSPSVNLRSDTEDPASSLYFLGSIICLA